MGGTVRLTKGPVTVLSAQAATGAGTTIDVRSYRHKEVVISVTGQGAGDVITVEAQGANQKTTDFDAASTTANDWTNIEMINLDDGSQITGNVGTTFSNSNTTRRFAINADGFQFVTLNITTYTDANSSGSATATLTAFTN